ncbi:TetR/AcrR family transcriptional regulator [Pseudomonas asplenii]|uniref:acrylate utilization transcriptional regulator AcuR n=1 Tax=Pseudomonas asplenii TaxID=53407 RepID=UPI0006B47251|nr:TetR/AcrR family transcriptional regulator [Pseudomonas fuscovaginae]KPA95951.1 transcriptional regulator, TetR family [Pseudomonas fuscovaginae]
MTTRNVVPRKPGRPPKVPREHQQTRELLVRCGTEILTEQGFMSTGIDVVLKRVGVPKGSFYHYFHSKEAFGQAVLANYAGYFARKLDRWFLDESLSPLQRLRGFVDEAKAGMARHAFRRGCLVGNLGQEVTQLPDSYREQLEAVLRSWEQRLSVCLQAAQQAGELAVTADCPALASFFWIGWEGAVLRARLVGSEAPLETFMQGFMGSLTR